MFSFADAVAGRIRHSRLVWRRFVIGRCRLKAWLATNLLDGWSAGVPEYQIRLYSLVRFLAIVLVANRQSQGRLGFSVIGLIDTVLFGLPVQSRYTTSANFVLVHISHIFIGRMRLKRRHKKPITL